jgi:hypothetical protein
MGSARTSTSCSLRTTTLVRAFQNKTNSSEFGDLRPGQSTGNILKSMLNLDYIVICAGDSGWRLRNREERGSKHIREVALLYADSEGKAQGVSIERGMRVQDVLGRMIVMKVAGNVSTEGDITTGSSLRKQSLALGVIGCQCIKKN